MLDSLKHNLPTLLSLAFIVATYIIFAIRVAPSLRKHGVAPERHGIGIELGLLSLIALAYLVALARTFQHH